MSPLGHLSISYVIGNISKKLIFPAVIIGGLLPDVDFFLLLFPWFNQIHRVITHNLFFILLISLSGIILTRKDIKIAVFISLFAGGILHLLVDSCMDSNPSNGMGITWFWPLSYKHYLFFNLISPSSAKTNWNEPLLMLKSSVHYLILEVPFCLIAGAIFIIKLKKNMTLITRPLLPQGEEEKIPPTHEGKK